MSETAIEEVIHIWRNEFAELSANPSIKYIQIFENKGEIMGCSNPHPHGQVWAS
jgi:UDPglucose--hexose-1-phosphate uridylyltransferase